MGGLLTNTTSVARECVTTSRLMEGLTGDRIIATLDFRATNLPVETWIILCTGAQLNRSTRIGLQWLLVRNKMLAIRLTKTKPPAIGRPPSEAIFDVDFVVGFGIPLATCPGAGRVIRTPSG